MGKTSGWLSEIQMNWSCPEEKIHPLLTINAMPAQRVSVPFMKAIQHISSRHTTPTAPLHITCPFLPVSKICQEAGYLSQRPTLESAPGSNVNSPPPIQSRPNRHAKDHQHSHLASETFSSLPPSNMSPIPAQRQPPAQHSQPPLTMSPATTTTTTPTGTRPSI